MARGKNDGDLYYRPSGSSRFNVKFKDGALDNRVTAKYLVGCQVDGIEWIYIIEAKRQATPAEIKQLCAGKWK